MFVVPESTEPEAELEIAPRKISWFWIGLLAVLPFLGFWTYGLFDLDEGFYAAVAAEMNRRGEWITPYYNGHPWFEKPILLYWCSKPSLMAFGAMIGPRLPSVLATLALFAVVASFVRRHISEVAAQRSVLVLAGSLLVVGVGRMMLVDPLLNLCFAASMLVFWASITGRPRGRALSGLLLGLSVLAKGPIGVILFALVAGWTYWKLEGLRSGFRGGWLGFFASFGLAVASWYIPAFLVNGQTFVQKFLVEQNLQRFTGGDSAHNVGLVGLPLYALVLVVGMAPWSWFAFRAWPRSPSEPLERYLAAWAAITFGLFTISGTKLPHYILPAAVPIAIIAATRLGRERRGIAGSDLFLHAVAIVAIGVASQIGFTLYYDHDNAELHKIARYVKLQDGTVAAYQMPRRQSDLGTLKPKVQETSHPSLPFYINKDLAEPESFGDLLRLTTPVWVITRIGRMGDEEVREAAVHAKKLAVVPIVGAQNNYVLYRLEEAGPESGRHD